MIFVDGSSGFGIAFLVSVRAAHLLLKRSAFVLALFLAAATCSADQSADDGSASSETDTALAQDHQTVEPSTLAGAYLAGLFAQSHDELEDAASLIRTSLSADPENRFLQRRALYVFSEAGRLELAVRMSESLLEHEEVPLARWVLAIEALRLSQTETAKEHLQNIGGDEFLEYHALLLRSWIDFAQGDPVSAQRHLDRIPLISEQIAGSPGIMLLAGLVRAMAMDRTSSAQADWEKLYALRNPRLIWLEVNHLQRRDKFALASEQWHRFFGGQRPGAVEEDLKTILQRTTRPAPLVQGVRDGAAELLFFSAFLQMFRTQKGVLTLLHQVLSLSPGFELAQLSLGEVLLSRGKPEEALHVYSLIPEESVLARTALLRSAEVLLQTGRSEEALAILAISAEKSTDSYIPWFLHGEVLRKQERFATAAQSYSEAIDRLGTLHEDDWKLFYYRGMSFERSGHWQQAERDFMQALQLKPEQPFVLNYLAYSWIEQGRKLMQAKEMLLQATHEEPHNPFITDSLGWAYYRLGNYERAVEALESAVLLRAQDAVINDHLGDAYWRVGRQREARFQWKRALGLDAEEEEAEKIRKKLAEGLI